MPNGCRGQCLLSKTGDKLRIVADEVGQNDLYGVKGLEVCVAGLVNDAHSALAEPSVKVVFSFEHRRSVDGMRRRHTVVRARSDIVGKAIFTKLTFSHLWLGLDLRPDYTFRRPFL